MTDNMTALLALGILGILGLALIAASVIIKLRVSGKTKACSARTSGVVVKHGFSGEGRMFPVIEFSADGKTYLAKKKFNGYKSIRISGPPVQMKADAYEDEKGYLHVKLGPIADLRKLAEKLWPVGSSMNVYYDPADPKKNYVDGPARSSFTVMMFAAAGLFCVILGVIMYFVIR